MILDDFSVEKTMLGYMLIYLVSISVFLMLKHACFYCQNFFHYALDIFKKNILTSHVVRSRMS